MGVFTFRVQTQK